MKRRNIPISLATRERLALLLLGVFALASALPAAAREGVPADARKSVPAPGRFATECFELDLLPGFKRFLREKTNPWKPWIGRWGYGKGDIRLYAECDDAIAGTLGHIRPPKEILPSLTNWKLKSDSKETVEDDRVARGVVGTGQLGTEKVLVIQIWARVLKAKIDIRYALVYPEGKPRKLAQTLLARLSKSRTIDPLSKAILLRRVYGPTGKPPKDGPNR